MGRGGSSLRFVTYVFCKHRKGPEMHGLVREILLSADVHRVTLEYGLRKLWEVNTEDCQTTTMQTKSDTKERSGNWSIPESIPDRQYKGQRTFKVNLNFKIFNWREMVLKRIPFVCRENCSVDVCRRRKHSQDRKFNS